MIVTARCADCDKSYRVSAEFAGRMLRCKACGGTVTVGPVPPRVKVPVPVPGVLSRDHRPPDIYAAPPPPPRPAAQFPPVDSTHDIAMAPSPLPRTPRVRAAASAPRNRAPEGDDAYVHWPGEAGVDRWVMLVTFVATACVLSAPVAISAYFTYNNPFGQTGSWETFTKGLSRYGTMLAMRVIPGIAVMSGLLLLGVFVASRLARYVLPPGVVRRCLTVTLAPVVVRGIVLFGGLNESEPGRGPLDLSPLWVMATALAWVVAFVLLFRLRPTRLLATLASAGVCCYLVPGIVWVLVMTTRAGGFAGMLPRWSSSSPSSPSANRSVAPVDRALPGVGRTTAGTPGGAGQGRGPSAAVAPDSTPKPPISTGGADRPAIEAGLAKIGRAARAYADGHDGHFPTRLDVLVSEGLLERGDLRDPRGFPYAYRGQFLREAPSPEFLVAFDLATSDGHRTVLLGDGRTKTIPLAEFGTVLRESAQSMRGKPK